MPNNALRKVVFSIALVLPATGAFAFALASNWLRPGRAATAAAARMPIGRTIVQSPSAQHTIKPRNLSLQSEGFKIARRLGQRFSPREREKSNLVGTVTLGSIARAIEITRTQTDDGERIQVKMPGLGVLNWDAGEGPRSSAGRATGSDRELIERLVLDSPDQFVLAQLRGASYYTLAHNVRPVDADDSYAGPVWDVIRVEDADQDTERRPQSRWRLYYISSRTGLIDKVVSEIGGEQVEAEFQNWIQQAEERWPTRIVWKKQGLKLMELSVTSISLSAAGIGGVP